MAEVEDAPRFRLLPLVLGLAVLAFVAHGASLARAVEEIKGDEEPAAAAAPAPAPAEDAEDKAQDQEEDTPAAPALPEAKAPPGGWKDPADTDTGGSEAKVEAQGGLADRAAALDKREADLVAQKALLEATAKALEEKIAALEALRAEVGTAVGARMQAQSAQVERLVKIYEGMKAQDAARLFDAQDPSLSVAVMREMSTRKLSPVLAAMDADRARMLTVMLAKAPPTVPTEDKKGQ